MGSENLSFLSPSWSSPTPAPPTTAWALPALAPCVPAAPASLFLSSALPPGLLGTSCPQPPVSCVPQPQPLPQRTPLTSGPSAVTPVLHSLPLTKEAHDSLLFLDSEPCQQMEPHPQPIGQTLAFLAAAAGIHGRDVKEKAVSCEPQGRGQGLCKRRGDCDGDSQDLKRPQVEHDWQLSSPAHPAEQTLREEGSGASSVLPQLLRVQSQGLPRFTRSKDRPEWIAQGFPADAPEPASCAVTTHAQPVRGLTTFRGR